MWRTGLIAPWHVGASWTRARTVFPALAGRFSTTAPPGNPCFFFFILFFFLVLKLMLFHLGFFSLTSSPPASLVSVRSRILLCMDEFIHLFGNRQSRLSPVFPTHRLYIGASYSPLLRSDGFARAARRTQENSLLSSSPLYYKRI